MRARFASKANPVRERLSRSISLSAGRLSMSEAAVISRSTVHGNPSPAGSVLIIDDEAEIRESLQTLLEMEGFEVETAVTGEDGLAQIGDRPFDLVLLDLALPGRDGMDILAEIRSQDSRLPVIMITAYGTGEKAVRAMHPAAAKSPPPPRPGCCKVKAARAKKSSPKRFTSIRPAATSRSFPSTPAPCPPTYWSRRCSATSREPSPAPSPRRKDYSKLP